MGRLSINKNDEWHVAHDRQDIRGWVVRDASGKTVGRVRDLIADTDSGLVESVLLDNGEEIPASTIEIGYGDKIVYLASAHAARHVKEGGETASEAYRDTRIRQREHGEAKGFARHEPTFREHYRATYGEGEREYGQYHGAYRIGYDYGTDAGYQNRDWDAIEGEIRKDYETRHGEGTWDRVKEAARHAFADARSSTSSDTSSSRTTRGTSNTS